MEKYHMVRPSVGRFISHQRFIFLLSKGIKSLNVNLPIKCNILNIRVFTTELRALLFSLLPLQLRVDVMLNGVIHELVLGFGLHHAGALRSHHLNCAMDIDLAVESFAIDLVENHVYHDECTSSTDAG